MMDVMGRPGTGSGLTLRVAQFAFGSYSALFPYCTNLLPGYVNNLKDSKQASMKFVGIFSFSAATAPAGITIFLKKDTQFCRAFPQLICDQYEQSVILAFVAWSFLAASALSLFWFRASL
ncbi:hypothetical protein EJB05_44507 [Eragrostis curvula]|uniref:CASP-like protein n=1 Tax=Eragrostis curvula TaxID=38414 RepID=A0A5J9TJW1_9POAL|nr:hypothetical protein EJB05_44507 [Eragrostis curvula]